MSVCARVSAGVGVGLCVCLSLGLRVRVRAYARVDEDDSDGCWATRVLPQPLVPVSNTRPVSSPPARPRTIRDQYDYKGLRGLADGEDVHRL